MAAKSKKPGAVIETPEETPMVPAAADSPWASFPTVSLEEFAELSRENIAALTKSNLALAEGLQAMTEELIGYARSTVASASQTATALLAAKTLDEVMQLNTELAKASLESLFSQSAKLSELGVNVASETFAPLGGRVEATFALLTKSAA